MEMRYRYYGPFGRSQLIVRDGKVPTITSNCSTLIQQNNLEDPMSIWMANVLQSFQKRNGDGTGSFLIALDQAMRSINALGDDQSIRIRLAYAFGYLQTNILPRFLLNPLFQRTIQLHVDNCHVFAKRIIHTCIHGTYSPSVAAFLTDMCADWVFRSAKVADCRTIQDFATLLLFIKNHWASLVYALPNASVDTSRLIANDFILQCTASQKFRQSIQRLETLSTRFVVCIGSSSVLEGSNHVSINSDIHEFHKNRAENLVHALMNDCNVSLLVMTQGLDLQMTQVCTQRGLAVIQYVDKDIALDLCRRARIQPVVSLLDQISKAEIGNCANVKLIRLGGAMHALFSGLSPHRLSPWIQLVLRAPTLGLQEQYIASLKKALTVLESLFHETIEGDNTTLSIVPGGCASFFYLHYLCQAQALEIRDSEANRIALSILSEAFLAVPRAFHAASSSRERFIEHSTQVNEFYKNNDKSLMRYCLRTCELMDSSNGQSITFLDTGLKLKAGETTSDDAVHPWSQISCTVNTLVSTLQQICRVG